MKVFIAEFTANTGTRISHYKITATSIGELKNAVMNELQSSVPNGITPEEKWKMIQENIVETDLVFPIIEESVWDG